jgi:hypothetical protein
MGRTKKFSEGEAKARSCCESGSSHALRRTSALARTEELVKENFFIRRVSHKDQTIRRVRILTKGE